VTAWLQPDEPRIGLGCMRLEVDDEATIAAAVESGITVFDTARAYEGSEALLAGTLRGVPGARVVTKGGMARPDGAWIPDGRAKAIGADCEASLEALDGLPIDLYSCTRPTRGRRGAHRSVRSRS
jgi:aryl-alcohol dehydrogenase-like predicted oxidoreductase